MTLSTIRLARCLQRLLEQADHARREALVHEQPVARVLRRVHVEHHHAARVERHVGSSPIGNWPDMMIVPPTSDEKVAESRFTSMRSSCFTTFQKPPPLASRCQDTGVLGPQPLEHLVVLEALEAVEVEEVDALDHGAFHGSSSGATGQVI